MKNLGLVLALVLSGLGVGGCQNPISEVLPLSDKETELVTHQLALDSNSQKITLAKSWKALPPSAFGDFAQHAFVFKNENLSLVGQPVAVGLTARQIVDSGEMGAAFFRFLDEETYQIKPKSTDAMQTMRFRVVSRSANYNVLLTCGGVVADVAEIAACDDALAGF